MPTAMPVEGALYGAVPLTTAGVLPALNLVENTSAATLKEDLLDFSTNLRAVLERGRAVLDAGTSTDRDMKQLEADLQGCAGDIRDFRVDLDAWRAIDSLVYDDGEALIALWTWERDLRAALVDALASIQEIQRLAGEIAVGRGETIYVSKSGDTWQSVAADQLGDWKEWPRLVATNSGDPATLAGGTVLTIPVRR
jgi:hypothetical protein